MKATLISKENNEAKFTIEITAEEFENAVIDVYKSQKDKFVIDGFRKGKAPRSIIEKKYGETIFFEDAINKLSLFIIRWHWMNWIWMLSTTRRQTSAN